MSETTKRFRNAIKQMTLEYLEQNLRNAQRELESNIYELRRLEKRQAELKKERAELSRMVEEYRK